MEISLIIILLFTGAMFFVLFIHFSNSRRIRELKEKSDFALKSEDLIKVEMNGKDALFKIADNFNKLGEKLTHYKKQNFVLTGTEVEKKSLDTKLKVFEANLSQLNMLTDIGKEITASLNVSEIATKLFKYIHSTMMAEEVSLLIIIEDKRQYYKVKNNHLEKIDNPEWCADRDNILNWSFENNKEVFLNNVEENYAQYVFKPITLQTGEVVGSVIAVPLNLSKVRIGAVSILCQSKNAFNDFHMDFSRSLSSYVSVAIYNANLYGELSLEKQKSEDLLLNILPEEVADELKDKGHSDAKLYKDVSIMFTDFQNFTGLSETLTPKELVEEIDYCFRTFDEIADRYGLEKIKTIGDSYFAVSGLPIENQQHAIKIVNAAKDILLFVSEPSLYYKKYPRNKDRNLKFPDKSESVFKGIRLGINSGPVIAGIVGSKKFAYDIWGDAVNVASRLESNSEINRINISGSTYQLVKDEIPCTYRGKINAKNKGEIDMYFVD